MEAIDPAAASAVAALENDPFYRSISVGYVNEPARRRAVLQQYFAYSIREGAEIGRSVHLDPPVLGVCVWVLPQRTDIKSRAAREKRSFLEATLDPVGYENYYRIVGFMSAKAGPLVGDYAWYLSIIAVDPSSQRQGLGRKLLRPTLAEADSLGATCYLETFNTRNIAFYERVGFVTKARFSEPTTQAEYVLMVRIPRLQLAQQP